MPSLSDSSKLSEQAKRNQRRSMLLAVIVLIVAGSISVWTSNKRQDHEAASSPATQDLTALWVWGGEQLEGGSEAGEWSIRMDAEHVGSGGGANLEKLALRLLDEKSTEAGNLQDKASLVRSGHPRGYEGTLAIRAIPGEKGQSWLLLYTADLNPSKDDLVAVCRFIERTLASEGLAYKISTRVRGQTSREDAAKRVAKLAQAELVEQYKDNGTISQTYYTDQLLQEVELREGVKANLQIARFPGRSPRAYTLVVGTPLITGDYSGQQ
ncbi:YwmB family TATA-box binding protein [Paenibacillus sp. GCM10023252]|uniref:YwmB family TATA-box binding protein n=1 Tax=Paenibacillus sp. GCM10023252 TaxID=3252649 RepID=UPI003620299B